MRICAAVALSAFCQHKAPRRFYAGKYDSLSQIKNFLVSRWVRIGIPYYLFLLIAFLFMCPSSLVENGWACVVRLVTFTYNGNPAISNGVGATWFISTLFQLYLVTPLFYHGLFKRIPRQYTYLLMLGFLLMGYTARYFLAYYHADWYKWVYTFSPLQWDVFFVPFLLNAYTPQLARLGEKARYRLQIVVPILFAYALFYASYGQYMGGSALYNYRYRLPTVFTFLMVLAGIAFSNNLRKNALPIDLTLPNIIKNPWHLLEAFAAVTLSFYLYHSAILTVMPRLLEAHPVAPCLYVWLTVDGGFLLSLLWAVIVFLLVERPLNKFRPRYATSPKDL